MKNLPKNAFFLVIFFASLLIFSCASGRSAQSLSPVYVTNTKKFVPLAPEHMDGALDALMLFEGSFGKQNFSALASVQSDFTGIVISLINDFGTDMGSLVYDGVTASFDSPVIPASLKAEYIVADFQFAFYDAQAVLSALAETGLIFEEETTSGGTIRRIRDGNRLIEEITVTRAQTVITNNLRGYEYRLTPAE